MSILAYDILSISCPFVFSNILGALFIFDISEGAGSRIDFHGQIGNPPHPSLARRWAIGLPVFGFCLALVIRNSSLLFLAGRRIGRPWVRNFTPPALPS